MHDEALAEERKAAVGGALGGLQGMTLSIVDGDFPRDHLANNNLTFSAHAMAQAKNSPVHYNARTKGPRPLGSDTKIVREKKKELPKKKSWWELW